MVIGTIEEEWKKRKREENCSFSVQQREREKCGKNKS
jgi:hypothetical protein